MAIYSCNLKSIGRTTAAPGTAGAHLAYIGREGAKPTIEAHIIPADPTNARTWMDREERAARANARLADKVRVAIPRELSEPQRLQLVRDFVSGITQNRVPWMLAIHQHGEDAHNPHAHIVLRDRDLDTGKRVLRLSDSARDRAKAGLEPKAVEWIRERWEHYANEALARAGHDVRIDRRSLEDQGVDRVPTIHIGPRGEEVERHVQRPTSKKRITGTGREIDYPAIDQGRTRMDRQAEIVDFNLERAARSPDLETQLWAKFEREQIKLDRQLDSELSAQARDRTKEERGVKAAFRERGQKLRDEWSASLQDRASQQRQELRTSTAALRARQADERSTLRGQQSSLWSRVKRSLDFTGGARRRQTDARREQIARHKAERAAFIQDSQQRRSALRVSIADQFRPRADQLRAERFDVLTAMRERHMRGEHSAEAKRQLREAAREQERQRVAEAIRALKVQAREVESQSPTTPAGNGSPQSARERLRSPNQAAFERARQSAERPDDATGRRRKEMQEHRSHRMNHSRLDIGR